MERRGGSGMHLLSDEGGTEKNVSSIEKHAETVDFTIEHFD